MTRYARAGKGTHNRVAKDPTPWDDMKPSEPERVRGAKDDGGKKRFPNKNRKKERFSKGGRSFGKKDPTECPNNNGSEEKSASNTPSDQPRDRNARKSNNANIRGFGQSKSVKILGQFWVPLEDGKRLKNLLKKLKAQGLPRKEILEALKNERRKAEKASKRQRDKTCFQCRQFGHILTDCPNLRKASTGESLTMQGEEEGMGEQGLVCFKCGSTEHTSRNCRRKGENFEFANCFICSGSGHIARQCPKNTNGIYPSGGSCGECGLTTHLKKDCPDIVGVDNDSDRKNDGDAVTLRMSDPFSSTEYEPIVDHNDNDASPSLQPHYDVVEEKKEDQNKYKEERDGRLFLTGANRISVRGPMPNKKGKRENNTIPEVSTSKLEFFGNKNVPPVTNKTLFANKKRKIVKF